MKLFFSLLLGSCSLAHGLATSPSLVKRDTGPKYRISPIDGSKIALPTKEQLVWQDKEIGVIIHFEIATYLSVDGCNNIPNLLPNVSLFDPTSLDTDQWVDTINSLSAKYATLVAKHNCGFTTWPSEVTFETRDNETIHYNYTIAQSPVHGKDVVKSFVESADKGDIGYGFYYSLMWNNFLNVQSGDVITSSWTPGQVNITNSTYNQVVLDQLTELWTQHGNLTEIWFDGGYTETQQAKIQSLLETQQPGAVVFNGCQTNGTCISANPVRWIGTEAGAAPEENWSSGLTNDGGDPQSPYFCPAECDTTLQTGDRWFYGVNQTLRSLEEMIDVYHNTVGRNCVLELDLAPDRSGLVPSNQAARYKELGDFIRSCYGNPVAHKVSRNDNGVYSFTFKKPTPIDRIVLMEDQTNGQVIRSYQVYAKIADSQTSNGHVPYTLISNGTSVGHKKIDIFNETISVTEVMVNSTYVDTPKWRSVTVHLCDK
ncbi:alpha-L-fucosidase [Penicillium cataractarum]|uniref:alpha-L-fucosidase n=1 Tax=Penicillium cataractarum TaxID=2100454 RepID=A0A9W9R9H6_9EURO|nr:alpha-L-fucosidase [Penicillium cataractarum]KAJ5355169.1 alpha-L-fucosidase [Penicillium cataractarum]